MNRICQMALLTLLIFSVMVVVSGESHASEPYPSVRGPLTAEMDSEGDVAFVVSVEDYFRLPPVPGARETGRDWVTYFRDGLGVERVYDLMDQEVTQETMRRFARQAADDVEEGATLWFVFVGHGAPSADGNDGLLVGVDAQQNLDSLMARSIAQRDLMRILEGGSQGRTVAFVDACFSGRDSDGDAIVPGLQPVLPVAHQPEMSSRSVILSAAGSDEFAGPLPGAQRPAFSYWMLGALRGWAAEDGEVTAAGALDFTRDKLRSVSGMVQTPAGFGDLDLVLVRGVQEEDPLPGWDGRSPVVDVLGAIDEEGGGGLAALVGSGSPIDKEESQRRVGPLQLTHHTREWRLANRDAGRAAMGAEIYRWLGEDELARQYEDNDSARLRGARNGRIMSLTGWASMAAGAGLFATARYGSIDADDPAVTHCQDYLQSAVRENCRAQQHYEDSSGMRVASYVFVGAGLVAAFSGSVIRARSLGKRVHPISVSQARELVEDANQAILDGDTGEEEIVEDEGGMSFYLTPYFSPGDDGGTGIRLGLRW